MITAEHLNKIADGLAMITTAFRDMAEATTNTAAATDVIAEAATQCGDTRTQTVWENQFPDGSPEARSTFPCLIELNHLGYHVDRDGDTW